jgi:hypothetical protein
MKWLQQKPGKSRADVEVDWRSMIYENFTADYRNGSVNVFDAVINKM